MEEKGVNTDPDWETKMRILEDETKLLMQEYKDITKQQVAENKEHKMKVKNLEQMINEKKSQYQTLSDKLDSLQLKLEHSNRKANQKKFLAKKEEHLKELRQIEEKGRSLTVELEEKKEALGLLEDEHALQTETWGKEIAALREERDRLKKQVEEGNTIVLREEVEALEFQREVYISELEEWVTEAERHIQSLRMNQSPEYLHQSLEWENKVASIRSVIFSLQEQFNMMIQQIERGQMLEDLPTVALPPLPEVPVLLYFSQPATHQPPGFMGRPFRAPLPARMGPVGLSSQAADRPAPPGFGASAASALHPLGPVGSLPAFRGLAPGHPSVAPQRPLQRTTTTPPPPGSTAFAGQAASAGAAAAGGAGAAPHPPQPSQLDKVLQMLGSRLPTKTKAELTTALQQIKSARGTLAGMAMEDLYTQVAERLENSQKPVMRPIGPPSVGSALQRSYGLPPGIQVPLQRQQPVVNFCLMCQGQVDEHSRYKMNCSHVFHTKCIRVWLQSGVNKACPMCAD